MFDYPKNRLRSTKRHFCQTPAGCRYTLDTKIFLPKFAEMFFRFHPAIYHVVSMKDRFFYPEHNCQESFLLIDLLRQDIQLNYVVHLQKIQNE